MAVAMFWMKVLKGKSGCWEWQGQRNEYGYGVYELRTDGKRTRFLTHRLAYELTVGPIPAGDQIRHLCRNRKCCNPNHMRTGSNMDNVYDREFHKGKITAEEWKEFTKTTEWSGYRIPEGLGPKMASQCLAVLGLMVKGLTVGEIAEKLDVDPMTVKRARRRMRAGSVG